MKTYCAALTFTQLVDLLSCKIGDRDEFVSDCAKPGIDGKDFNPVSVAGVYARKMLRDLCISETGLAQEIACAYVNG